MIFPEVLSMRAFQIQDVKSFMSHLLLSNTFDRFLLTEASITTFNTFFINGHLHNVSYLEAALEAVPEDIYKNVDFNYIRIEYKKEIMQNDNIKIKCLTDNNYNCLVIFETDNKMNAVVELKLL